MVLSLKDFKSALDPQIEAFVNRKTEEILTNTNDDFLKEILRYSKNLITGGGKRIRPYMIYLSYISFGGKSEKEILNILISMELFHNYALIHDDVIDKGKTRHGQKTIPLYTLEKLKSEKRTGDIEHIANSYAILIGDILYGWLLDLFLENKSLNNLTSAFKYFNKMADEVLLGQIVDADLASRDNPNLELIEEKTRLKTSRYTFVRPMQIGAILANMSHDQDSFLEELGTRLGIAFQMKDDLLDIVGNQKNIQKTPLLDVSQHQHTFYSYYVLKNGNPNQKRVFKDVFGKDLSGKEIEIRKIFDESGAIKFGENKIKENLAHAQSLVIKSNFSMEIKDKFFDLIRLIEERNN